MPSFFIYLLKANIALTVCYLAYRLGLRRLTFYALNRFFLLFGIMFSAVFPLVDINAFFHRHERLAAGLGHYSLDWGALQQVMRPQQAFTLSDVLQYIFWAGAAVMTIRLLTQLISLLRIHLHSGSAIVNGEKVRLMRGKLNPFSFFRQIYINPSLHSPEDIRSILAHEKIHVKGWHTADVMTGEVNNIFYWFNPGAWLMRAAIRENLEFITDRKILQMGMDARAYQYSLVKVSGIPYATALANNFYFSRLKQRIMMMNKKRSSRVNFLRYVLLVPAMAGVILLIFTNSRGQKNNLVKKTTSILNPDTIRVPKKIPEGYPKDYRDFLERNPAVSGLRWSTPENGMASVVIVVRKDGKVEQYHLNNNGEMKTATAKYGNFPRSPAPPPEARVYSVPPLGSEKSVARPAAGPHEQTQIAPFDHKKDSVPQPPNPKVIFAPPIVVTDSNLFLHSQDNYYAKLAIQATRKKHYDKAEEYIRQSLEINPNNQTAKTARYYIKAVKYYEREQKEYINTHEKNPNPKVKFTAPRVVRDSVPGQVASAPSKNEPVLVKGVDGHNPPLVVVNDTIVPYVKIQGLNPNRIASVTVLKDETAIRKYGNKGKNGVIMITTKGRNNASQAEKNGSPSYVVTGSPITVNGKPAETHTDEYVFKNNMTDDEISRMEEVSLKKSKIKMEVTSISRDPSTKLITDISVKATDLETGSTASFSDASGSKGGILGVVSKTWDKKMKVEAFGVN